MNAGIANGLCFVEEGIELGEMLGRRALDRCGECPVEDNQDNLLGCKTSAMLCHV